MALKRQAVEVLVSKDYRQGGQRQKGLRQEAGRLAVARHCCR